MSNSSGEFGRQMSIFVEKVVKLQNANVYAFGANIFDNFDTVWTNGKTVSNRGSALTDAFFLNDLAL